MRYLGLVTIALVWGAASLSGEELVLTLRYQQETSPASGRYHRLERQETWPAEETAVIVCDVWDLHHSWNAVRRLEEFAPRLNEVLDEARRRGATIIHAPSDCMDAYSNHPARQRALATPPAATLPADIRSWCSRIPAEEQAVYPLDQSDGGDDDDPEEHAVWVKKLEQLGRNPGLPWKKQSDLITIDSARDFISDRGDEVWNILEQRGIKRVILTGVHVNMCVLGRPFGLRQLARHGKHVVLMRDLTDTMYNPARWPYVSHFTGNDLIVSHIERLVCPTIASDQLLGGEPFRFQHDRRPHVVIVMAEDEYETERTLPKFAAEQLGRQFRVSLVFAADDKPNELPGLDVALPSADVALVSIRRRPLRPDQLALFRQFVAAGKPVVGIRTASHAFSLRNAAPPEGLDAWPEFDAQVFGGNYTNHHGNDLKSTVRIVPSAQEHPLLREIDRAPFQQGGSLYITAPLAVGTTPLLTGEISGKPMETVAWTFARADGGRSFYTSLGHRQDFDNPVFQRLLVNALLWATASTVPASPSSLPHNTTAAQHWSAIQLPVSDRDLHAIAPDSENSTGWLRCAVRLREAWLDASELTLEVSPGDVEVNAWFNGRSLERATVSPLHLTFTIPREAVEVNDANLVVLRVVDPRRLGGTRLTARLVHGKHRVELNGRWQVRIGDDPSWSNMPLPARYGASTDILFEP